MSEVAVFTDLDGSLLDARTYSFDAARPALAELARRGVPLVPVTTKTAAETCRVQERLGFPGPFVAEDGAGVGLPDGSLLPLAPRRESFRDLVEVFRRLAPGLVVLSELDPAAAARETGLPLLEAALAVRRDFDEAFRVGGDVDLAPFEQLAEARGLRITRGGRWLHLHGETDKGEAVRRLRALLGPHRAIGLGDSPLDLPLLRAVEVAVAIPRPDGTVDPVLAAHPGVTTAPHPGPAGWNESVLRWLG